MKKYFLFVVSFFIAAIGVQVSAQYQMPKLKYNYNALEPHIDAQTMEIHYSKHHQAYLNNLNKALEGSKAASLPLEELLIAAERRGNTIRNNGGGHYNHTLFWDILSPTAAKNPDGKLAAEINKYFTSTDSLKKLLNAGATTRFGSGWVWLYVTTDKKLAVCSTPNQDNPIMDAAKEHRGIPILGIDVWEHAYYLKYQNKRGDYLGAIWNVIDWAVVGSRYNEAINNPLLKLIEKDSWLELKNFHMVMGQTFHPMEEGNLAPIRARSGEMVEKAKLLKAAKVPASFQSPAITKAIDDLVKGSESLHKLASKKGKDAKIKESLTKLHDTFHVIQGLCSDDH
ncbi:MAG: superoxide dismutase [Saprospiraceae bacterium]|nr:superoxide dismutase [Saprospiraceae bacterium]